MQSRFAAVGLAIFVAVVPALWAAEMEPCQKEWEGQRLADSLYNIDLMVKLLGRLKGSEDPKLRSLMELSLQFAARNAVDAIDHGGEMASPYAAINFLHPVNEAQKYATEHQVNGAPAALDEPSPKSLSANLGILATWLEKRK